MSLKLLQYQKKVWQINEEMIATSFSINILFFDHYGFIVHQDMTLSDQDSIGTT